MGFFFFFFNGLENIPTVKQAFSNICLPKLLYDGYFDMSRYIFNRCTKEEMMHRLALDKSQFIKLYQIDYPDKDNAYSEWLKLFPDSRSDKFLTELTQSETEAIVNWVYMTMKTIEERVEFTYQLIDEICDDPQIHHIRETIKHEDGVFYNSDIVELKIIPSIARFNSCISNYINDNRPLFYRGHSDANYYLQPSLFRNENWLKNERAMYNELLINCPDDFEKCHSHLEKLVEMQHYGLPTRLLDITRNPLVALYFACESKPDCFGEIILLSAENSQIKYPQSDTASVLASLAALDYNTKDELYVWVKDPTIDKDKFNQRATKLLHEIRLEKPAFRAEIVKEDLTENIIVTTIKNNRRIAKQDGAFILCGLYNNKNNQNKFESLNKFRLKNKNKTVVFLIKNKDKILKQLSNFSINRATLFPEIECVADHIKNKYIN